MKSQYEKAGGKIRKETDSEESGEERKETGKKTRDIAKDTAGNTANELARHLAADGKLEELLQAAADESVCQKLLKEYRI